PHAGRITGPSECVFRDHLAALQGLQQRVMEVPCHAGPFRQSFVEARVERMSKLAYSKPDHRPDHKDRDQYGPDEKRPGLVPGRCDDGAQRRAFFVPDSVVVGSDHSETIRSRTEIAVERLPPSSRFLPRRVAAFKAIAKQHSLRRDEAESDVVDLEIPR